VARIARASLAPRTQAPVLVAAEEGIAIANAFAFRNMQAAVVTREHAFGFIERARAPAAAGLRIAATDPVQGTTHPPDADKNEDEDEQIAHGTGCNRNISL